MISELTTVSESNTSEKSSPVYQPPKAFTGSPSVLFQTGTGRLPAFLFLVTVMSPETETPAAAASAPMLKETVQESSGFIFTFNKEF